ncbi:MAG: IclR family transcriptional regulator [Aquisalimonadaceae bacterium]
MSETELKVRQGVQSVETGLRIARCLAANSQPMPLKDISQASGIAAAKVHRYLVSMARAGLVEQQPETGLYDLGPLALEFGVAALERLDVVELAVRTLRRLRDDLDETVALSIWGSHGTTIVRWFDSSQSVIVNVRLGSVLPLLTSASGKCFLAHLPSKVTEPFVHAELADPASPYSTLDEVQALADGARAEGLGRVVGEVLAGISGLAGPIFNQQGEIVAAVAALGPEQRFDASLDGKVARALRAETAELSQRLGYREHLSTGS